MPDHLLENLRNDARAVEAGIDAVDLDGAVGERARPVVVPEGEVEFHVAHDADFCSSGSTTPGLPAPSFDRRGRFATADLCPARIA